MPDDDHVSKTLGQYYPFHMAQSVIIFAGFTALLSLVITKRKDVGHLPKLTRAACMVSLIFGLLEPFHELWNGTFTILFKWAKSGINCDAMQPATILIGSHGYHGLFLFWVERLRSTFSHSPHAVSNRLLYALRSFIWRVFFQILGNIPGREGGLNVSCSISCVLRTVAQNRT